MPFHERPDRIRYPVALAIGAVAVFIRWAIDPLLGLRQPYMGSLVATFVATRRCGRGPGFLTLLTTFLASDWLFCEPRFTLFAGDAPRVAASVITLLFGAGMNWIISEERAARDAARREAAMSGGKQRELEREVERRRSLEDELRLSREQFRMLVNRAPVAILGADADGMCTFANDKWYEITGRTAGETLGHAWGDAVHPDDLAVTMSRWRHTVETNEPYLNQVRIVHTDGTVHPVFAAAQAIRGPDGKVVSFIGTVMDLTDMQQRETMLRTLIDAQEREKQSLCHEFHDGLIQYAVGSRMLLEAYLRDHPDLPQREVVTSVIEHLARGIDDGRALIRGIRTAVLDDLGLPAALDDLVDQAAAAGIVVTAAIRLDERPLPAALQTTVYRVVQESLANVRRHSGVHEARVTLLQTGPRLDLEIADCGCGFDPATARRRGFGLTGMIERVRLAGGECRIDSAPGHGTRIVVTLPVTEAAAMPA